MLSNCEIKIAFHVRKHEMWSIRIFKHVLLLHRLKKKWITTKHFIVLSILLRVLCYARVFVRIVREKKKKRVETWARVIYTECVVYFYCLFLLSFIIFHSFEWDISFTDTFFFLVNKMQRRGTYTFALCISNLEI